MTALPREPGHRNRLPLPELGRPLTPRTVEAIKSRFRFGSQKDAAAAMHISEHTVRNYISEAIERTGASNFPDLVYRLYLHDLWDDT